MDRTAFGDFYRRTSRSLWSYVYRVTGNAADADDIVQDTMIRLSEKYADRPPAELPLLFNGFVRGSNARERFAGTGLGLASSRQLVESQGGSLEIASVQGCGTTVTIRLPF